MVYKTREEIAENGFIWFSTKWINHVTLYANGHALEPIFHGR